MKKITKISAEQPWWSVEAKEVFQFRELFGVFALRDIKVKYKQTVIGALWAILQPFSTMIIFSFFFGKIAEIDVGDIPYPLFSYAGVTIWTMFTTALTQSSNSLVSNSHLISKVYFPRLIIPIASTIVAFIDYLIALSVMGLIMMYFKFIPPLTVVLVPFVALGALLLANGIGFFLSALNVQFRDVRYALPFFIQLLIFVSPVIYPASLGGQYQWLVEVNPMTGYLEAHRSLLLGHQPFDFDSLAYSIIATIAIFMSGYFYFSHAQRKFADLI
jgi:lipopolysaccharide transport system permease protein